MTRFLPRSWNSTLVFCLVWLCLFPFTAVGNDYAAAQRAREIIRKTVDDMYKVAARVSPAAEGAQTSRLMDTEPWTRLATTSNAYKSYALDSLNIIDQQVKNLLDNDPGAALPDIPLPSLYHDHISRAKAAVDKVSQDRKSFQRILDLSNQAKSNLGESRLKDIMVTAVDLPFVLVPNLGEPELGPIGMLKDWYDRIQSLREFSSRQVSANKMADQIQGLASGARQGLQERAEQHRHLSDVWKKLLAYQKDMSALGKEVAKYRQRWLSYAESAGRRAGGKASADVKKMPEPRPIKFRKPWYEENPPPPISAGEISGGANGHISTLMGAYDTALAGDADAYVTVAWDVAERLGKDYRKLSEKSSKIWEDVKRAEDAYNKQWTAIYERMRSQLAALRKQNLKSDEYYRRVSAIYESARSQMKAARQQIVPVYRKRDLLRRERTLHWAITSRVSEAHWTLADGLARAAAAAANQYRELNRAGSDETRALWQKQYMAIRDLPPAWRLEAWQQQLQNIDAEIRSWLSSGTSPTELRSRYLLLADELRSMESVAKKGLNEYLSAATELRSVAGRYERELHTLLDSLGGLMAINFGRRPRYPSFGSTPGDRPESLAPDIRDRVQYMKEDATKYFGATANDDEKHPSAEAVQTIPMTVLAAGFDAAARKVEEYEDWKNIYSFRRNKVTARLDEASRRWFEKAYWELNSDIVDKGVVELDTGSPWDDLRVSLDAAIGEDWKLKSRPSWAGTNLSRRMRVAVQTLGSRAGEAFRDWQRSRRYNAFVSVPAKARREVRAELERLKTVVDSFNRAAGSDAAEATAHLDAINEAMGPVDAVLGKMPDFLRQGLAAEDRRFRNRKGLVVRFLKRVQDQRQKVGETQLANIENMFRLYEESRKEYQEWLRKQEIEAEKRRKEREKEEAERKRREEEARRAREEKERLALEAEKGALDDVRSLYADFASAYSDSDVDGLIRLLDDDWEGAGEAVVEDVETNLDNSFRVFDFVSFRITNLQVMRMPDGNFKVSYQAQISGEVRRPRLKHEESVNVLEIVGMRGGQLRILRTLSGRHFIRR